MVDKKQSFSADIAGLMNIFSNSLYSEQDVFLRELISNSADAISKLRLKSLADESIAVAEGKIKIEVVGNWLEVSDNGIGMTEEELANICTIARSGTQSFINSMNESDQKQSQLIGKFGVGFYSVFMVADKVEVITRSALSDKAFIWESDGTGYTVSDYDKAELGTIVRLHLKDSAKDFLKHSNIERIVENYSKHLHVPVELITKDQESDEAKAKVINNTDVIWHRSKSEIKKEEYNEFYKSITYDLADPLAWVHQKIESTTTDYTMLLYVPSQAPFDLYMKDRANGVKLYVKRVFIMADPEKLMPSYMRFVRGIIDCQDLPLNVSRELLQNEQQLSGIRAGCVKKIIAKLSKMSKDGGDGYAAFWNNFGPVLKEGPTEDPNNAEKLYPLFRFASSLGDSSEQTVSLDDYINRISDNKKKIYYLIADSYQSAISSPHLEYFKKQGIEVLLLSDKVDEWLMSQMIEYKDFKFQSIIQGDFDSILGDETSESSDKVQEEATEHKDVFERVNKILSDKIKHVRSTERLVDSPCCLVSDKQDMSQHLQRLLQQAGQSVPQSKPILELNVAHPLVQGMLNEQNESAFEDWANLLFEEAQLLEGATLKEPSEFVKRLNRLLEPLLS